MLEKLFRETIVSFCQAAQCIRAIPEVCQPKFSKTVLFIVLDLREKIKKAKSNGIQWRIQTFATFADANVRFSENFLHTRKWQLIRKLIE